MLGERENSKEMERENIKERERENRKEREREKESGRESLLGVETVTLFFFESHGSNCL